MSSKHGFYITTEGCLEDFQEANVWDKILSLLASKSVNDITIDSHRD